MFVNFSDFDYIESDIDGIALVSTSLSLDSNKDTTSEIMNARTSLVIKPKENKLSDYLFSRSLDSSIIERIDLINLTKEDEIQTEVLKKFVTDHIDKPIPDITLDLLLNKLNDEYINKVKKSEEDDLRKEMIVLNTAAKFYSSCIDDFYDSLKFRKLQRKQAQSVVIQKLKNQRDEKIAEENKRIVEIEKQKKEELEKEKLRIQQEELKKRQADEQEAKMLQIQKQKEEQQRQMQQAAKNAEAARKAQAEKDAQVKLEEEQQQKKLDEETAKNITERKASSNLEVKLDRYIQVCLDFRRNVKLVMLNDPNLVSTKKQCNALRRKINPKFGQLINSFSKVNTITLEIVSFVEQSKQLGNQNAELSQFIHKWFMYTLTKLIIKQAEKEIRVSMKAAMPLAYVVIYLLIKFPDLKEILLAKFIKKCPYILGYSASFSTIQGRIKMGWKFANKEKKIFESDLEYNERVGGIFTLWSMITTVRLHDNMAIFNVLGSLPADTNSLILQPIMISKSWIMISRLMNIEKSLINNSHFFMLCNWFQIAGQAFINAYGKQGRKLIQLICFEFTKGFAGKEYTYSSKLSSLGEEWQTLGKFNDFEPMMN